MCYYTDMDNKIKIGLGIGAGYLLLRQPVMQRLLWLFFLACVIAAIWPDSEAEVGSPEWEAARAQADQKLQKSIRDTKEFRASVARGEPAREGLAWAKTVDITQIAKLCKNKMESGNALKNTIDEVLPGCRNEDGMACWTLMKLSQLYHVD